MSNTAIQLEFLKVEEGDTVLLTIPEDSTAEDVAYIIRDYLHENPGTVLTEVYIDHSFHRKYDDPIDMLMNMTNPCEGWTVEDAKHIMSEAEAQGWHLDPQLTPEDILDIYNDLEPEEEDD